MRRRQFIYATLPVIASGCTFPVPEINRDRIDPPRADLPQVPALPRTSELLFPYRLSLPRRNVGWFKDIEVRFTPNDESPQTIRFEPAPGISVQPETATLAVGATTLSIRVGIARSAAMGPETGFSIAWSGGLFEKSHRVAINFYDPDGQWAVLGNLEMCGVHAASLSDGRVLFLSYYNRHQVSHRLGKMQLIDSDMAPLGDRLIGSVITLDDYNPFCAGHCFLGDGRLLIAGGHRHTVQNDGQVNHSRRVHVFDPRLGGGLAPPRPARRSDMQNDRWYPSCLTLASGDAMILGGSAPLAFDPFNSVNEDLEWYSLARNDIQAGAPRAPGSLGRSYPRRRGAADRNDGREYQEDGQRLAGLYPLVHLLPVRSSEQSPMYGMVCAVTEMFARIYDPVRNRLIGEPIDVGGSRTWPTQGSSVLLPIDIDAAGEGPDIVRIMLFGGGTTGKQNADHTAWSGYEILEYDIRSHSLTIVARESLLRRRFMGDSVLLPSGEIAILGGAGAGYTDNNKQRRVELELLSPTSNPLRWLTRTAASARDARGYHASAVLAANGTIIVSGGNEGFADGGPAGREFLSVERYAPPYLSAGPQPEIETAPSATEYGQVIEVITNEPLIDPWLTLIRYGSRTHSLDTDQRMLRLHAIEYDGSQTIRARIPNNRSYMPPGDYMLFVMREQGGQTVPSRARTISLR